jgi:choline dehydrogenase
MPKLTSLLSLTLLLLTEPILSTPPPKFSNTTYDYIVIGSGPGGGTVASNLARSNHTVLLLDAGDLSTPSPTSYDQYPSSLTWDFFVKHYASPEKQLKNNHLTWRTKEGRYWVGKGVGEEKPEGAELLGVYYPRGATVGGSSMINAMVTFLPSERDWEVIVNVTGDGSWS